MEKHLREESERELKFLKVWGEELGVSLNATKKRDTMLKKIKKYYKEQEDAA